MTEAARLTRSIRIWLGLFIVGLFLSGITAFPLQSETALLSRFADHALAPVLAAWIGRVHDGVTDENARYPFLAYGTDWLAFAHLVLAVVFCWAMAAARPQQMVHHFRSHRLRGCRSISADRRCRS
jgi:hypothetical protein